MIPEVSAFATIKAPLPIVKQDIKVVRSFNLFNLANDDSLNNKKFPIDIIWMPDPHADNVVTCDSLGDLILVNAKTKALKGKLKLDNSWMYSVDYCPDHEIILGVGSLGAKIHLVQYLPDENKKLVEI